MKVIDFGLAAIKGASSEEEFNTALGTPFFVAPEVIDRKIRYDEKCDLWSVGVIFYVLLTGQHPFFTLDCRTSGGGGFGKLFERVQKDPPHKKPLQKLSRPARNLILSLLQKEAFRRPSASEALQSEFIQAVRGERTRATRMAFGSGSSFSLTSSMTPGVLRPRGTSEDTGSFEEADEAKTPASSGDPSSSPGTSSMAFSSPIFF